MGEARRKALAARRGAGDEPAQPLVVDTLGGRMHVRWDEGAAATPHGQLVFFAEFLAATGVFERWVSSCPLAYRSGNAPDKRDVLGTLMLGLLAGHRRYAHITALRGDAVAAQALGMAKVVSEDALRRALERIDEAASAAWMRPSLMHSVREALNRPWVLDIDASIKPLYGRQEGAQIVARQKQKVAQWDSFPHCISHRAALPLYPRNSGPKQSPSVARTLQHRFHTDLFHFRQII